MHAIQCAFLRIRADHTALALCRDQASIIEWPMFVFLEPYFDEMFLNQNDNDGKIVFFVC